MAPASVENANGNELSRGYEPFNPSEFDVDTKIENFFESKGIARALGSNALADILSVEL